MRSDRLMWFLAGVGLGAAAGVLLAPRSGSETRRQVAGYLDYERGRELYDRGRHIADEAAEMFEQARRLMEPEQV